MQLARYFPTPIWSIDTTIDLTSLKSLYEQLLQKDPKGRSVSNFGGWQSVEFMPKDFEVTKQFANTVEELTNACLEDYGIDTLDFKTTITNMWFSNNKKNDFNQTHIHGGSFLSGTFYIEVPELESGCGEIVFNRNHFEEHFLATIKGAINKSTPLNSKTCKYLPKVGGLIVFPSYLQHCVLPSGVDEDRISLSFNMDFNRRIL